MKRDTYRSYYLIIHTQSKKKKFCHYENVQAKFTDEHRDLLKNGALSAVGLL